MSCQGTINYMAPEVLQGNKVNFSTDIWSFGCILYEFIFGESLFKSKNYVRLKVLTDLENSII